MKDLVGGNADIAPGAEENLVAGKVDEVVGGLDSAVEEDPGWAVHYTQGDREWYKNHERADTEMPLRGRTGCEIQKTRWKRVKGTESSIANPSWVYAL